MILRSLKCWLEYIPPFGWLRQHAHNDVCRHIDFNEHMRCFISSNQRQKDEGFVEANGS